MSKISKLIKLENRIMKCDKCPRLRKVTPIPYPHICMADNIDEVEFMFVGRNPGLEHSYEDVSESKFLETYQKRWVASKAGKYIINKVGLLLIKNKSIWVNICKCSSPDNSFLKPQEIKNCKIYLERQISIIKPRVIFTFGSEALKWFFPKESLNKSHTKKIPLGNNRILIPMYHYAYFLRTKNVKKNKRQNEVFKDIWM